MPVSAMTGVPGDHVEEDVGHVAAALAVSDAETDRVDPFEARIRCVAVEGSLRGDARDDQRAVLRLTRLAAEGNGVTVQVVIVVQELAAQEFVGGVGGGPEVVVPCHRRSVARNDVELRIEQQVR